MRIKHFGFKVILTVACLCISAPASAQNISLPSFADLVAKLSPSVVNISTTQKPEAFTAGEVIPTPESMDADSIISHLNKPHYALGSGFIIDENGYILTNNHVIDQAGGIKVVLSDNSVHEAKVIGSDSKTDIALIKIEADKKLQPVKFGNSDNIRVGDWILAIGNPFGLGGSVTAGIVSAKSRDIESGPYDNFIQTDASINQGSSGGPMFNLDGEVIGINTAIFSTTGGSMGIGFAIPANLADFVIKQLKENGKVNRGWIGVKIQPSLTLTGNSSKIAEGLLISGITEGSSAAAAGIEAGDIIISVNGKPVDSAQNFARQIAETSIGSEIALNIWRQNQEKEVKLKIEAMPSDNTQPIPAETPMANTDTNGNIPLETTTTMGEAPAPLTVPETPQKEPELLLNDTEAATPAPAPLPDYSYFDEENTDAYEYDFEASGITAKNLSMEDIAQYKLRPDTMGVIVTNVIQGGEAAMKGIKPGTIITQVNKQNVFNVNGIRDIVADAILAPGNAPTELTLISDGNVNTVTIRLKDK